MKNATCYKQVARKKIKSTLIMNKNSANVNTSIDNSNANSILESKLDLGTVPNSESFLTTANVPNSGTQCQDSNKLNIWVSGQNYILALSHLASIASIRLYNRDKLGTGENYFIDDGNTPEWEIKAKCYENPDRGWVRRINTPLENLISDGFTAKEFWIQCLDYAYSFRDWCTAKDNEKITVKDAIALAKVAFKYLKGLELETELDTLRIRCNQSSFDWNKRMESLEREFRQELEKRGLAVDPIGQDLDQQLKLDLLALLQESDPIKKIRKRAEICSYFRLSKSEVEELLKHINRSTNQEELKSYTIDELFDLESEGLTWVIPEMLPRGETVLLTGSPKAGKSLLAIDAAFAIATGESHFLGENVTTGKVLLVSCDESINSTKSKLLKRGFRRGDSIEVLPQWTIDRLHELEKKIEDYRPDVVIVDSLKRITHGIQISENSAEFADNIYTLKELFTKYNCSGILIHHSNKNNEAMGVHKVRGSSAITGAVWGTLQLDHIPKPDPNNKKKLIIDPKDPVRVLSVFARDTEGQTLKIEFNPENNSWERIAIEDDSIDLCYRERILSILRRNSHCEGLSGRQIMELLGESGNKSIYSELNRMVNKKLISCKLSTTDKRSNIYSLPNSQQPQNLGGDSPSPIPIVSTANYYPENLTTQGFNNSQQNSQQIVSNSQQLSEKTNLLTNENPCSVSISVDSQQLSEIGGGEGVSQTSVQVANKTEDNTTTDSVVNVDSLQIGDEIESHELPLSMDGRGKIRQIENDFVLVEWTGKHIPKSSITAIDGRPVG